MCQSPIRRESRATTRVTDSAKRWSRGSHPGANCGATFVSNQQTKPNRPSIAVNRRYREARPRTDTSPTWVAKPSPVTTTTHNATIYRAFRNRYTGTESHRDDMKIRASDPHTRSVPWEPADRSVPASAGRSSSRFLSSTAHVHDERRSRARESAYFLDRSGHVSLHIAFR